MIKQLLSYTSKLHYIPELRDLICIRSLSEILRVNDLVYSIVPSVYPPFDKSGQYEELKVLYDELIIRKIGGWCSLNAVMLNRFLDALGVKSEFLNYGIEEKFLTHMVLIVHFGGDRFVVDPFFNKYYRDRNKKLIIYSDLMMKIINREFDGIVPVYGTSRKPVKYIPAPLERDDSVQSEQWRNILPEVFEYRVMEKFRKAGLKKVLEIFGSDNPLLLMLFPLR